MSYIPRTKVKGQHYFIYSESGKKKIPTKAEMLRRALLKAKSVEDHAKFIDFIPARFTAQLHSWIPKTSPVYQYKSTQEKLKYINEVVFNAIKKGGDFVHEVMQTLGGKAHVDIRVQKLTSPSWFGWTLFRSPMLGTPDRKIMGTVKGYQSLIPQGRKLEKFLVERAQKAIVAGGGLAERQDRLEWLDVKSQWFPIGSTGNPQKSEDAFMVAWEYKQPAVLHRREIDFIDCTFLGKYLKGRYYYRLVERALSEDELTKEQKENIAKGKTKAYYGLFFYWWKAKTQFNLKEMEEIAKGKKVKEPIPAPPKKD